MNSDPKKPDDDLATLLRNADESDIRRRLGELDGEAAALRTLLRAVSARERARRVVEGKKTAR